MASSVSESQSRREPASAAIAEVFRGGEPIARLATRLAEVVRGLWPAAALSACLLREGNGSDAAVLGPDGKERPGLAETLLSQWEGTSSPAELTVGHQRLLVEPILHGDRVMGALAV